MSVLNKNYVWKQMNKMNECGGVVFEQQTGFQLDLNVCQYHPNFKKVKIVRCENAQLTSLPLWPNLTHIKCNHNNLTTLPLWPKVKEVYCSHNNLISLPLWPKVSVVFCNDNQLTSIPFWKKLVLDEENICIIRNPLPYAHKEEEEKEEELNDEEKYFMLSMLNSHLLEKSFVLKVRKFMRNKHEKKWRQVNAEITCRPETGEAWKAFEQTLNEMNI